MKNIRHLLILAAAAASFSLQAATIQFSSNSTEADSSEYNSIGANLVIQKNSAWADALSGSKWISFENTGDPSSEEFQTVPNSTIVSFFQNFSLAQTDQILFGSVSLYADDSSSVVLNGHTLQSEASGVNNNYSRCSDTQPDCVAVTTVNLPSQYLNAGANVLRFDVAQRAGSSFGLDYSGSVTGFTLFPIPNSSVPEPSTWALLASGILVLSRKRLFRGR